MISSSIKRILPTDVLKSSSRARIRGPIGIRTRLLAIVLIPSLALLAIGIGGAVYLVDDGRKSQDFSDVAASVTTPAIRMVEAMQDERQASLLHLAGSPRGTESLVVARRNADTALDGLYDLAQAAKEAQGAVASDVDGYSEVYDQLPQLRSAIDARVIPAAQVSMVFSTVIDTVVQASLVAAEIAPTPEIAVGLYNAVHALRAGEAVVRAASIGITAMLTGQLPAGQLSEFASQVGDARGEVAFSTGIIEGERLAELEAIIAGPDWQRLVAMEDAFIQRGPVAAEDSSPGSGSSSSSSSSSSSNSTAGSTSSNGSAGSADSDAALPMSAEDWERTADAVSAQLMGLWENLSRDQHAVAIAEGDELASNSLWVGGGILAIALIAFAAAMLLANRFVGRMRGLRRETLELADEKLPATIRKLSAGQDLRADEDIAPLKFGNDEIGQVADAFNRAYASAVAAAVAEGKTRAGVNAVFLNIAHRSQVMVHRQLVLLDKAEREEEDPDRLDTLFQLDHLATRSRRNAENLVILGGEQPGRRWRNPVPLVELVRSAVAESLDYTRIQAGKLPEVRVLGNVVADLIHLIAELTDNATAFSPPESRVEVSGNLVGKGLALEITDQGLGMSEAELSERNELLAEPPDFSVAALSGDARLGLFVVAKLAARHGISVRLTDSDYGGVKAIVLVPTPLLSTGREQAQVTSGPAAVPAAPAAASPPPQPGGYPVPHPSTTTTAVMQPMGGGLAGRGTFNGFVPPATTVSTVSAPGAPVEQPAAAPGKPALPRRRRQTPAATQPMPADTPPPSPAAARPRTAEQARNLMSAIENGTRQGRLNRIDTDAGHPASDHKEGAGDDSSAP
ncbi:sensor histidine kinase [Nocardia shimofusensis]|uniref:sensor histidine kinase n=1 Tax=Nocardia shimofusensis TaxID=228596 RepID=UPI000AA1BC09|nr:nitrate- and nitrite sensing domain-containing protein [Nocardia shimofusensis]